MMLVDTDNYAGGPLIHFKLQNGDDTILFHLLTVTFQNYTHIYILYICICLDKD